MSEEPTRLVVGPGEADNTEFGEILGSYRVAAELSRGDAAAKLEITSEYLRLIEKGQRTPVFGSMPKLLTLYNVGFQMGYDSVTFDGYSVEFTSRIREPRYTEATSPRPDRDVRIGQIVRLLVTADDSTLLDIHRMLTRG